MLCWYYALTLCLQKVMKLVSWMACWRRCSLVLLSGEREDHGKQVHTHTHTHTSRTVNLYKTCRCFKVSCLSQFTDFCFFSHTFMVCILYWSTCSISDWIVPSPSFFLSLSKHNNRFVCVPLSLPHLLHSSVVVIFFGHGYGGQNQLHQCLAQQQKKREGVGSKILKRGATGEGVVVE